MLYLDKVNFDADLLQHSGKSFVMFSGDGWAPCEAIKPFVVVCSEKYADKIRFCLLDTTKSKRLAMSQKVMGLPTMVIYENGAEIDRLKKEDITEAAVEAFIQKHV